MNKREVMSMDYVGNGATMIEYALIAVLISVVAIVAMGFVGNVIKNTFGRVGNEITKSTNDSEKR